MKMLLLGPQGAGKGTQAARLARKTGARHIATGDLVRAEIEADTALGRRIKGYNDRGELVPDEIVVRLAEPLLTSSPSWILDGFPRTEAQARALDETLRRLGAELDRVVALEAPDDELLERLSGRRQSEATGRTYHVIYNPPPADDPGPFVQRADDAPDEIQRRLELYHQETQPLADYYARRGLLSRIDALAPIEAVTDAILRALTEADVPV